MSEELPLVSIIIVNWNGQKYLTKCLPSLKKQTYKNFEVFFVDNASEDNSLNYAKKNFPYFRYIENKNNLGYAEGHEKAFGMVKGKYVLLLSMDTILEKDALEYLVKNIEESKDIGAVQPKLLMYPSTTLIDSIGMFFSKSGILYHYGREKLHTRKKYNTSMEIFSAKGACLLFRVSVLRKTGLFDKDYFAYFEETDLCHRIWLAGYRIIYTPESVVYHTGGGASKRIASSFILFHAYKNRIQTYMKNLSWVYLIQVLPLTLIIYFCASAAYLLKGEAGTAFAIQKAIFWNLLHLKKILTKREFIQKRIRKIADNDFLPKLTRPVRISYYYYIFIGLERYRD